MAEPLQVVARICPPADESQVKNSAKPLLDSTIIRRQNQNSSSRSRHTRGPKGFTSKKQSRKAVPCAIASNSSTIRLHCPKDGTLVHSYKFDKAFASSDDNVTVFSAAVSSLVDSALEGFRCTCFAHGYLGTGKTHTMHGTAGEPGMVPLSVRRLFDCIADLQEGNNEAVLVKVGFVQLYDGKFFDLLSNQETPNGMGVGNSSSSSATSNSGSIELHEDPYAGPHIRGSLSLRTPAATVDDALALFSKGVQVRLCLKTRSLVAASISVLS